jgi:uncharacterized protein with PIN domain
MKFHCPRCNSKFEATPRPYPHPESQTKMYLENGDLVVCCPGCNRNYFLRSDGEFMSDRKLTRVSFEM